MRRVLAGLAAAVLLLAVPGCGTATFDNVFTVVVAGQGGTASNDRPLAVSVFDPLMGSSRQWAAQTMGTTTAAQPYVHAVPATATKMVLDSSPPKDVRVGLVLPSYNDNGYFQIAIQPNDGQTQEVTAGFAPWAEHYQAGRTVRPLLLTITSVATDHGWDLHVTVTIPRS